MADDGVKPESLEHCKPPPANESTKREALKPQPLRTSNTGPNRSPGHSLNSPLRHHTRNHTLPRKVKETLNARSEYTNSQDDGTAEHRINQYLIKQEIGRGSFGAVHLAVDQYGQEYAVKEFSKSRLRKRAQSHVLRSRHGIRRPGARAASAGFNEPLHRNPSGHDLDDGGNSLNLIKQEIAIMKKLNHPNLVSLFEVLDDPTEDSLYMVMEMCKKGVIMKVGLGEESDPYDDESCRCWFRDLILGIEYLHAQGIVHRDIKPDNCLLTGDDVLKVVDFGVSEMFEKDSKMFTAKSAGSPAFLPPELCVVKHGDVSGKATDIWSMGVTLYCLRYGRIPFEKESIFELYEAIRNDEVSCPGESDDNFKDLISKILEKDPKKRITMTELREHPWVTKDGIDHLLSAEENTRNLVEPPTEEEMNSAITRNMTHAITVVKAVQKFKRLIEPAGSRPMKSILGEDEESHFVQPPLSMDESDGYALPHNRKKHKPEAPSFLGVSDQRHGRTIQDTKGMSAFERMAASPSPRQNSDISEVSDKSSDAQRAGSRHSPLDPSATEKPAFQASPIGTPSKSSFSEGTRGHARDPLEEGNTYLFIGPSSSIPIPDPDTDPSSDPYTTPIVSESPGAADIDIYGTAYREEIERIRRRSRPSSAPVPRVYLTRRVDGKKSSLAELLEQARKDGTLLSTATAPLRGGATAFAQAVSRLNTSKQVDGNDGTPQSDSKDGALSAESKRQPQASLRPVSATVTTAVATAAEILRPGNPMENRSGLQHILNRAKDRS